MTCSRCQTINPEGSVTCASCGAPLVAGAPYAQPTYQPPPGYPPGGYVMMQPTMQPHTSGMAIAGFVLSFFCSILGLIFSLIGLSQVKKSNGQITGGGLAIAGIIISSLFLLINIIYIFAVISAGADASRSDWD